MRNKPVDTVLNQDAAIQIRTVRTIRMFFIIFFPLLFLFPVQARNTFTSLSFDHITSEEGLSQNTVTSILQDRRGFLWFGTHDGLNRYDGYEFKVFKPEPGKSGGLADSYIMSMCEDEDGLWIGTRKGLHYFSRLSEEFTRYVYEPDDSTSLSNDWIRALCRDREGNLWAGTLGGGLNLFRGSGKGFKRYRHDSGRPGSLSSDEVLSLAMDHQGVLWVGTRGGGVCRYNSGKDDFTVFRLDALNPEGPHGNAIRHIFEDSDHQLWFCTREDGLFRLDAERREWAVFRHDPDDAHSIGSNSLWSVLEDDRGDLWIGTYGGGLNRFRKADESFERFPHNPQNPRGLNSPTVRSLFFDASRNLWIGTRDAGINRINLSQDQFYHYRYNPHRRSIPGHPSVSALLADKNGRLWIGTNGGGLDCFHMENQSFRNFRYDEADPGSIGHNYVSALCEDSLGFIWVGTDGGGLNRLDPSTGRFDPFRHRPEDPAGLVSDHVTCLMRDRADGIWVGTRSGLVRYDPGRKSFYRAVRPDSGDAVPDVPVRALYQDRKGFIWVGTSGEGVYYLDPVRGILSTYRHDPLDPGSLGSDFILDIFEDQTGNLWFGTWGGGLNRLDRFAGTFSRAGENTEMENAVIFAILEDDHRHLWMSSNRGVFKFHPVLNTVEHYKTVHGLQGLEFNEKAAARSRSGEFFFGGPNGFNRFHPDSISVNDNKPPVVITRLLINNQPAGLRHTPDAAFRLESAITETDWLHLSHKQNGLTFHFAALDFMNPEDNRYAYRMEPLESKWNEAGTRRTVTYWHLAPGKYVFHVIGSNNDRVWNREGVSVSIEITPPFWATAFFRMLAVLAVAGSVFVVFRWRFRIVQKRNSRLMKINTQLNREISQRRKAESELKKTQHNLELRVAERTRDLIQTNEKLEKEIRGRRKIDRDRKQLIHKLQSAIENVKTLKGMLPICASCKKVRDDKGYWQQVEVYVSRHSEAEFSHGLCPECISKYYPGKDEDSQS